MTAHHCKDHFRAGTSPDGQKNDSCHQDSKKKHLSISEGMKIYFKIKDVAFKC